MWAVYYLFTKPQKTAREGAKSIKVGRNRPAQNRHVRKNPQEKETTEKHFSKSNPIICVDFSETYLDECFILRHNEHVFIFLWKSRGMPGHGDHIPALVLKCWLGISASSISLPEQHSQVPATTVSSPPPCFYLREWNG